MRVTEAETREQPINSGWLTAIAILMIVLGIVAIVFPFFATITSTLVFGWIFIFAGIAQIAYAFQSKGAGRVAWKFILGLLYLLAGIFVVTDPLQGALAFTLVLGVTIVVQGIIQISLSLQMRRASTNWGWMLVSGIIGIILGTFICSIFPSSAAWLIGTWVGIDLLFDGMWMLTLHSGQFRTLP
jgi:uncharacterized membrane protein HdeD (DUF308 family)